MGSIEVYDYKNKRWVPYVPDYKKWEQHFSDLSEGRVRVDHKGRNLVGSGSRSDTPKSQKVSQLAQKELVNKTPKVIRGRANVVKGNAKRKRTFNQLD